MSKQSRLRTLFHYSVLGVSLMLGNAYAQEAVTVGDTATVAHWEWVTVVNERPVTQHYSNATVGLGAGEICGIETGGTVIILGADATHVLVRYIAPGAPLGTPCPSGVEFLMTPAHVQGMRVTFQQDQARAQAQRELVDRLRKSK